MLPRFNLLLEWLCRWYLSNAALSERFVQTARRLMDEGTLFYVIRDRSYAETVAVNYLLRRQGLPIVPFCGNLRLRRLAPLGQLLRAFGETLLRWLRLAPGRPHYRRRLLQALRGQEHGLVFLKRSKRIREDFFDGNDPFAILSEEARHSNRPIYLLPVFPILDMQPEPVKPTVRTRILGSGSDPALLRRAWQYLQAFRGAKFECGDAVSVQRFVAANPGVSEPALVRRLKLAVLEEFAAERRVYAGPKLRDRLDLKSEILRSPQLYDFMLSQAAREGVSREQILERADKMLDEMASDPSLNVALVLKRILYWGLGKSYSSVELDREGLERVKAALKQGPVILLPNHSSHVDYLIISCVFNDEHLMLPHIAAGDNLTFWPMGPIFRKSSAFFIRRSFRSDRLYTQVFDTYLSYLLSEGFAIEFFIEGTRARNGRLLPPQFGMLSRIMGNYAEGHTGKLTLVPVGIDYERIFEENAYRRELQGGAKTKESAASLLHIGKMLNVDRGRIYLKFGDPIDVSDYCRGSGLNLGNPKDRREITRRLGWDIVAGIQSARTVTASAAIAAALLADLHRAVTLDRLIGRCEHYRELLLRKKVRLGRGIDENADEIERRETYEDALKRFIATGTVNRVACDGADTFVMAPGEYLILDYYRNALANPLADASFAAMAVLAQLREAKGATEKTPLDAEALEGPFELLSSLLARELVGGLNGGLAAGLEGLVQTGALQNGAGPLSVGDAEKLREVAWVLRPLVEGYYATLSGLGRLGGEAHEKGALFEKLLDQVKTLYASGHICCRELLTSVIVDRALETLSERGIVERDERAAEGGKKQTRLLVKKPKEALTLGERLGAVLVK